MSRAAEDARVAPEVMARYEPVIGLEVHVQLKTATKVFCACRSSFGDPPNTNVCPVCLGLPGALPVLNKGAVEKAVRAALALHCTVREVSRFARKNYFYPDLPKGYQISMYELPLATGGWIEIEHEGAAKRIGITRLHMEDDAAKALHEGFSDSGEKTYIDFNRCGVPLAEIVSEPDMRAPAEAYAYLTALKQTLEYAEISDCDMEKGSLRCDANVSVRLRGMEKFGTKTEVKNLNSFRYVQRAIEHEIERQVALLESGGRVTQETRLWNVAEARTEPMRSKEFAHDYRYFPEPDLLPLQVSGAWKAEIAAAMPELPDAKRTRFLAGYGISPYDAGVLTATRALADYFEATVKAGAPAKAAANWIQTELLRRLNDARQEIASTLVTPIALAELIGLVENGTLSGKLGKSVLDDMFASGKRPSQVILEKGLRQITSESEIEELIVQTILENLHKIDLYHGGKETVRASLVGDIMKRTKGKASPSVVQTQLSSILSLWEARVDTSGEPSSTGLFRALLSLYPETWRLTTLGTSTDMGLVHKEEKWEN